MRLKWTELCWYLKDIDPDNPFKQKFLGNDKELSAMRIGDDVLISSTSTIIPKDEREIIIPAGTNISGFGPAFDEQTLKERMLEGVEYNCTLRTEEEMGIW